jgi:hypothetical protein
VIRWSASDAEGAAAVIGGIPECALPIRPYERAHPEDRRRWICQPLPGLGRWPRPGRPWPEPIAMAAVMHMEAADQPVEHRFDQVADPGPTDVRAGQGHVDGERVDAKSSRTRSDGVWAKPGPPISGRPGQRLPEVSYDLTDRRPSPARVGNLIDQAVRHIVTSIGAATASARHTPRPPRSERAPAIPVGCAPGASAEFSSAVIGNR